MSNHQMLEGVTLKALLTELVAHYGWESLAEKININCFKSDPSVSSSLKFLRRTPWARAKVEELYINYKSPNAAIWGQIQPKAQPK